MIFDRDLIILFSGHLQGNPLCRKGSLVMVSTFKVTALFWGPRRIKEPRELNPSLGAYKLLKSSSEVLLHVLHFVMAWMD